MDNFAEFPKLGFGIMRLPYDNNQIDMEKTREMIDEYMNGDFCYFDMHRNYASGQSESVVRELVVKRYPRESFLLANKIPVYVKTETDYEKFFKQSLDSCGVSWFDYYLIHSITKEVYDRHERLGGFKFLSKLKEQGKVHHIVFLFMISRNC